jgi:hypothetical protein
MTNSHVISALRLKRAEISGHIHDLEKRIARQRANLLFSPGTNPDTIPPKRPIAGHDISRTMNCPGLHKTLCGQRQDRSRRLK